MNTTNLIKLDETTFNSKKPKISFILSDGIWIAGGSVRRWYSGESSEDGDIDVFTKTPEQLNDMDELLDDFDFVYCQFVWTIDGVFASYGVTDAVNNRELVINNIRNTEIQNLRRAIKFHRQGYKIGNNVMVEILEGIRGLNAIEFYEQLETRLSST